jgi:hypothetical protein
VGRCLTREVAVVTTDRHAVITCRTGDGRTWTFDVDVVTDTGVETASATCTREEVEHMVAVTLARLAATR